MQTVCFVHSSGTKTFLSNTQPAMLCDGVRKWWGGELLYLGVFFLNLICHFNHDTLFSILVPFLCMFLCGVWLQVPDNHN